MTKKQKIVAKLLVLFLLIGAFVIPTPAAEVQAASQKALRVSYSFNGKNYKTDSNFYVNNLYDIRVMGTNTSTAVKNLKSGAIIYIPKKTLDVKGATIELDIVLDVYDSTTYNYTGTLYGKVTATVANVQGKIKTYAYDNVKKKSVKASSYVSWKNGKGAAKNYYVITLKNIPNTGSVVNNSGNEVEKVTSSTKHPFTVSVFVTGGDTKTSGNLFVDDIVVKKGNTKVVSWDFSSKVPSQYVVYNKNKRLSSSKVTITTIK